MYQSASNLSKRSGSIWTLPQALAIIYYIVINGEFVANEELFPLRELTANQIEEYCNRLEEESYQCYHCNGDLTFVQGSGFSQFSPDNQNPGTQYYTPGNRTVRSCFFCQFFFGKMSPEKRQCAISDLLSSKYRPELGDKVLDCYENDSTDVDAKSQGVDGKETYFSRKYWATKYFDQGPEEKERKRLADVSKTTGKPKGKAGKPDIRKWRDENECCEFGRLFDNRCIVTGFTISDGVGSISMDRIWDIDGVYTPNDVMLLWAPLNYAKAKVPFFKTKADLLAYKIKLGLGTISDRKASVIVIREALERLISFQRSRRQIVE